MWSRGAEKGVFELIFGPRGPGFTTQIGRARNAEMRVFVTFSRLVHAASERLRRGLRWVRCGLQLGWEGFMADQAAPGSRCAATIVRAARTLVDRWAPAALSVVRAMTCKALRA